MELSNKRGFFTYGGGSFYVWQNAKDNSSWSSMHDACYRYGDCVYLVAIETEKEMKQIANHLLKLNRKLSLEYWNSEIY